MVKGCQTLPLRLCCIQIKRQLMLLTFQKYQGTGNDFVMIDQRTHKYIDHNDQKLIAFLCDRRFGIGADGLILLEPSEIYDFKMVYFNADGRQSTMCGNGGRCIVHFAWSLGVCGEETSFEAIDGLHKGKILDKDSVSIQMSDVQQITIKPDQTYVLNTGSPHYVKLLDHLPDNIKTSGAEIRYNEDYKQEGINVNFVKINQHNIEVATYERGVEDETLSCGTGVTAAAIATYLDKQDNNNLVNIQTKGGQLSVSFEQDGHTFKNIWLTGPATKVFDGEIDL